MTHDALGVGILEKQRAVMMSSYSGPLEAVFRTGKTSPCKLYSLLQLYCPCFKTLTKLQALKTEIQSFDQVSGFGLAVAWY